MFLISYLGQVKSPAVCQVHLDEAVKLPAHPLQAHQVLQWQITQDMWDEYILPGQVQEMKSAEEKTFVSAEL